ncbi:MAG TPA: membrane-bound lytic murein transglycosylase MltF [Alphaproteobacteria bacterium]|nr:membrane-bound lytic murein transglycosylase MltF [Alphaproteobacteria bacterium]
MGGQTSPYQGAALLNRFISLAILIGCFGLALALTGCDWRMESPKITQIRERGVLRVATRNAPTTYYLGRDQTPEGFEHDLAQSFAEYLHVGVVFNIYHSRRELLAAVHHGEVDLAAAGLTQFRDPDEKFSFGPAYQNVDQQVVCRRGGPRPNNLLQLAGVHLVIAEGGGVQNRLNELKGLIPHLFWKVEPSLSVEQILEKVWLGEIDCTIADSNVIAINRRYYPELVVKFPLGDATPLAWILPKGEELLSLELDQWFQEMKKNGQLESIFERYYGYLDYYHDDYDYVENRVFMVRINERLPEYEEIFREAEKKVQTPWKLLAALAYQESQWDPHAKSPTGVRGMMMLTQETADHIGVRNRMDPLESIIGGGGYLRSLKQKLPSEIGEPDRTWIALAAYNVGIGHIHDARELALQFGKNPNLWVDLQTVLPLLSVEKFHKNLKRGYARGLEPVQYVKRIRHYYDILERWNLIGPAITGTTPKSASLPASDAANSLPGNPPLRKRSSG